MQILTIKNYFMKHLLKFTLLLLVASFLCSCWINKQVVIQDPQYLGNQFDQMKGLTKNEILQAMGVPDRSTSDGNGGEIMRYENRKLITNSFANSSTTTNSQGGAIAGYNTYGNPVVYDASQSKTNYGYASNTTTTEQVQFVEAFINGQGICYKVRANVGDIYSKPVYECHKVANSGLLWMLMPPITIYGIPVAIWYLCNRNKIKPCN